MSWQKCVAAETCSLAVPPPVVAGLNAVYMLVWLSSLTLAIPPEFTALLWITLFRSWRQTAAFADINARRVFWLDRKGRMYVDEAPRSTIAGLASGAAHQRLEYADPIETRDASERPKSRHQLPSGLPVTDGQQYYTCCRSVRVPGCIAITLVKDHGKPLEILVFYRYHQRQFYRRLIRHLAYC